MQKRQKGKGMIFSMRHLSLLLSSVLLIVLKRKMKHLMFLHSATASVIIKYVLKGIEASNPQLSLLLACRPNPADKTFHP